MICRQKQTHARQDLRTHTYMHARNDTLNIKKKKSTTCITKSAPLLTYLFIYKVGQITKFLFVFVFKYVMRKTVDH